MAAVDRPLSVRCCLRAALCALAVVLASALAACAKPAAAPASAQKVYRVALFSNRDYQPWHDEVGKAMERDGFVLGQNLVIEYRYAEGRDDLLDAMAKEMVAENFDALVVSSTPTIAAAQRATTSIPIVMASSADPVTSGFVKSLQEPGGNITGIATLSTQFARKRLELLRDAVPGLARVAVIYDPSNSVRRQEFGHTRSAAAELGLEAEEFHVRSAADFAPAFEATEEWGAGAAMAFSDAVLSTNSGAFIRITESYALPVMFERDHWTEEGGLMSYGPSLASQYRRSGEMVSKILKGANPADIPVEIPPKLELTINLRAAQAFNVPSGVLEQADRRIVG